MSDNQEYDLEIWQAGVCVASVQGYDFDRVHSDAMHYAFQYMQDGPIEIKGIPLEKIDDLKAKLSRP